MGNCNFKAEAEKEAHQGKKSISSSKIIQTFTEDRVTLLYDLVKIYRK